MSENPDQSWRRQSAIFAAWASAFIGLGVALVLLMTWKDARTPQKGPAPAAEMQNPKNH